MPERYQREIEEILGQAGETAPQRKLKTDNVNPALALISFVGRAIGSRVYPSLGRLVFVALCLLLSAVLISAIVPGITGPIVWVALVLFIMFYAMFSSQHRPKPEKRWRGRPVEPLSPPYGNVDALWVKIQRWLR